MNIGEILGSQTARHAKPQPVGDPNEQLDKKDFLRLLLEQLKNQDPLKPMEDREFVVQLAQFRTLEQMQETNSNLKTLLDYQHFSLAGSLIGKTVEASVDGKAITGTVSGVRLRDNQVLLDVDGTEVDLGKIVRIRQTGEHAGTQQG